MRARTTRIVRAHPVRAVFFAVFILALLVSIGSRLVALARWQHFATSIAAVSHAPTRGEPVERTWDFRFRGAQQHLTLHVYPSEVARAKAVETAWVFGSRGNVRARYVRSLVYAQVDSRLITSIAQQTRALRTQLDLDSDGYLELVVRAVQEIPYGTPEAEIFTPAELVAGGRGVCSEKGILLAALLVHEGFDTAVFALDSHQHVAVGVASDGARFLGTRYAFIETTRPAYIGEFDASYLGWGPGGTPPQTIALGGTKHYTVGAETRFILNRLESTRSTTRRLQTYADLVANDRSNWGNRYGSLATDYHRAGRVAAFITANSDDRPRVYRMLTRTPYAIATP